MLTGGDDLHRAANDRLPSGWVQLIETFGENGNVGRSDLEKPVAAERTAFALQLLRLLPRDVVKMRVRLLKNVSITHRSRSTYGMTTFVSVW